VIAAIADPKVKGITCHIAYLFNRGLIDVVRQGHWLEEPWNSSIACRQTGPMVIDTIETDEGGQEIFRQHQNLAVKIRRAWTLDVEVGPEELDRRRQAACSKGRRPTGPPMRRTGAIAAGASRYTTTTARLLLGGELRGWRAAGYPPVRHASFNSSAACQVVPVRSTPRPLVVVSCEEFSARAAN
jgi:CreA protein